MIIPQAIVDVKSFFPLVLPVHFTTSYSFSHNSAK